MISYLISLNVWAILIYIGSKVEVDPFILLATGMLCMAFSFAACWVILKYGRYA
jgi:hypothetical protein